MTQDQRDVAWMDDAFVQAARGQGLTSPNPAVGCVVIRSGKPVGRGFHAKAGGPHAEVEALQRAGGKARGATLYVTLEPCSTHGRTGACTEAIREAGIRRVVVSIRDPNPAHAGRGIKTLRKWGIAVDLGVSRDKGNQLIKPFGKWITTGLPFVTLKMGMTLDGRIADQAGRSRWITGASSRKIVSDLRKKCDVVIIGGKTAITDDPSLCFKKGSRRNPVRIIVDSHCSLPCDAQVFSHSDVAKTIIATTRESPLQRRLAYEKKGAQVWVLPSSGGQVSLKSLFRRIGKAQFLHVLCEGGGVLSQAMVDAMLIDEFLFFVAPTLLGGGGVPVMGQGAWSLPRCPQLKISGSEAVGRDLLIRAIPDRRVSKQRRSTK